jgi:hypothetical protein
LAARMPGANTPSRSTVPLLLSSQAEEATDLELKEEGALPAARREMGKIQHQYEAAKKANPQHELSGAQINILHKHFKDLASDPSPQSQELRNEIIQFLQEVAPHAIRFLESEPSQALPIPKPGHSRDIPLAAVYLFKENNVHITNAQELVKALNSAQTKQDQQLLRCWLWAYLDCFAKTGPLQAADLEEYSALAEINPKDPENKRLLRNYFESLYLRIKHCEQQEEENALMQGLYRILPMIDPDVFEGDPSCIIDLAFLLLDEKLNPSKKVFTKSNYPTHSPVLDALNQILVLIQQVAPGEWNVKRENWPYQKIKSQLEDIAKLDSCYSRYSHGCCNCYSACCCPTESDTYYPCVYKIQLILQSLARLEAAPDRLEYLLRAGGVFRGLCHAENAILSLLPVGGNVPHITFNEVTAAWEYCKKGMRGQRVHQGTWYEYVQAMANMSLHSLTDEKAYELKLKEQYKDTCSHMGALFGHDPLPITEAHFHLEVLEEVEEREAKEELEKKEAQDQLAARQARQQRVKKPITLDELFKSRTIKKGGQERQQEPQRVLLIGPAGTGKTTICRKLAYDWAQGQWGKEFEALYVLPIRALQRSAYDDSSLRKKPT